jgi:CRP/FNR family transcriptional regulator, dissimilatory nitrate respiration regulator
MDWLQAVKGKQEASYNKGEVVISKGDPVKGIYYLKSGHVEAVNISYDGDHVGRHLIHPGELIGTSFLFSNNKNFTLQMSAVDDKTTLVFIPRREVEDLIFSDRELGLSFIRNLSHIAQTSIAVSTLLSYRSIKERVVFYLSIYGMKDTKKSLLCSDKQKEIVIRLPDKKKNIAQMMGTIPETLSRTFKQLEDEGLIEVKGREVHILDCYKMKAVIASPVLV